MKANSLYAGVGDNRVEPTSTSALKLSNQNVCNRVKPRLLAAGRKSTKCQKITFIYNNLLPLTSKLSTDDDYGD